MENRVLAVVNGKSITENDLDQALLRFPRDRQGYLRTEEGRKQLLEQIISYELIFNYAQDNGMEKDPEYINKLEVFKKDILTEVAINRVLSEVSVSDEEVKGYYEANKNAFNSEESVNASHILVSSEEEAKDIISKLNSGMVFEEAAKEYSSCPSKAQGGNLGDFTRGKMVPEFESAAFELPVGAISEPVKTQFGYHIIKVLDRQPASIRPFEEVSLMIQNNLIQQRQNYRYMEFTNNLKNVYSVEIK